MINVVEHFFHLFFGHSYIIFRYAYLKHLPVYQLRYYYFFIVEFNDFFIHAAYRSLGR